VNSIDQQSKKLQQPNHEHIEMMACVEIKKEKCHTNLNNNIDGEDEMERRN
jgi:hypothetical protein